MTAQLALFDSGTQQACFSPISSGKPYKNRRLTPVLSDTPRSRRTDPVTSHEAADAIKASGELGRQQLAVLEALRRWPGSTSLELAGRMGVGRHVTGRRLPDLAPIHARQGDPKKGEYRVINGRRHVQWWPV